MNRYPTGVTRLRSWVEDGNAGILQELERMRVLSEPTMRVVTVVNAILAGESGTPLDAVGLIYRWVQSHMRYTPDATAPDEVDVLHAADVLLELIERQGYAAGDCDDYVILLAAMLKALGLAPSFVVVSQRPDQLFEHVYLSVYLSGRIAMDAIHGQPLGWELPGHLVTATLETPA